MENKLKIKSEIKRLKEKGYPIDTFEGSAGYYDALDEVLNFIDSLPEEPVSEDLEEAAILHYKDVMEYEAKTGLKPAYMTSFKAGAQWQKEQFENNRLKHCNSITNEQAELEQGFIDQHLDKHQRIPTFLDAIEYGMNLQKNKMIEDAIETSVMTAFAIGLHIEVKLDPNKYSFGDKVKLVIIKEDEL